MNPIGYLPLVAAALALAIGLFLQRRWHRQRVLELVTRLEALEAHVRPEARAPADGDTSAVEAKPSGETEETVAKAPASGTLGDEPFLSTRQEELGVAGQSVDIKGRISQLLENALGDEPILKGMARQSLMFISSHVDEKISVARLAKAVHASSRTLQRKLRESLGCSPEELITAVKMREAKYMLLSGELRVNEVAYRLGFESPDHFSRQFKSYYSHSPSALIS